MLGCAITAAGWVSGSRKRAQSDAKETQDGVTVLKRIREWSRVPVIILSVRDQEEEKVAALDRLNRTQEAYDILASGVKRFPNQAQVHYDLACYACKIRLLNEAMSSLEKAIDVSEKDIRSMALNDPALEKLWVNISEI